MKNKNQLCFFLPKLEETELYPLIRLTQQDEWNTSAEVKWPKKSLF